MNYTYIIVQKENGVGKLILNRPEKLNAIIGGMRDEILRALEDLAHDSSVRVVIVTGAGCGFCAGGDINYLASLLEKKDWKEFKVQLEIGCKAVTLLHTMPKPTIAAVNGPAAGAGLDLAIACDIRIASNKAAFGATFSKIGLQPDWGGSWFLPKLIGFSRACELVFTGSMIDARDAERIGLVNHVYAEEVFQEKVDEFAFSLATGPAKAIASAKEVLWQSEQNSFQKILEKEIENQIACFQSKEGAEGIRAFLEKRTPNFIGKY